MKKTQIERAIEALEIKKSDLAAKYGAEVNGLDAAINELRSQGQRRRARPRAVGARVVNELPA